MKELVPVAAMESKPLVHQAPKKTLIARDGFGVNSDTTTHQDAEKCELGDGLAKGLLIACSPLMAFVPCCSSILAVDQRTEVLVFRWGKYESTLTEPGLYWNNCFGRSIRTASTTIQSMDLPRGGSMRSTVLDSRGNPLVVSAVVVYQVCDTYKATVSTLNYTQFIETQGESVLKAVIGRFPYECPDADTPSLQQNSDQVCEALLTELQANIDMAGIEIQSFRLKEISYAPVIAAAMLKRQQAQAMVEARQTIVNGAVDMSTSAIQSLKDRGVVLDERTTAQLVSNLLTVICSETEVQPTLPLGRSA